MTLSAILLWVVVGLVVILLALLFTPIRLRVFLRSSPQLAYRVDAKVFGGVSPSIPIVDSARPRKPKTKRPKKQQAKRQRKSRFLRRTNILSAVSELLFGLLEAFHFQYCYIDLEFGMNDPADTGKIYGFLTPFPYCGCSPQDVSFSVQPNFEQACFVGEVDASVRVTAATLLWPVIRFGWKVFGVGK